MVPGRFKDYISTPKRNGYRSLHTSVIHDPRCASKSRSATRRCTPRPNAGSPPTGRTRRQSGRRRQGPWISDLVEILDHADSPEELLEHTRMAMYQDRIFAFTPKGELIQLPKGATPVDFAYAVHTDLGDQTVGAKVNGRVVPLRTILENGDQVEILLEAQPPQPQWLRFVVTGKARAGDPPLRPPQGARRDDRARPQDLRRDRRPPARAARHRCDQARAQDAEGRGRGCADGRDRARSSATPS